MVRHYNVEREKKIIYFNFRLHKKRQQKRKKGADVL